MLVDISGFGGKESKTNESTIIGHCKRPFHKVHAHLTELRALYTQLIKKYLSSEVQNT